VSTFTPSWPFPQADVRLAPGEVHVWCASLERAPNGVAELASVLSEDEQARAARYHSPVGRRQFMVARGLLRTLLGRYLSLDPKRITFALGPQGKPGLAGSARPHFNVSHSHGVALIAVTDRTEVGVDVERLRHLSSQMELADRFFSPWEAATLRALDPEARCERFFHLWTRKEAFLKAHGAGLSFGLERVEMTHDPEEVRVLRIDGSTEAAAAWALRGLTPAPGYVGALALQDHDFTLRCWHWPGDSGDA
jgi:4'-phosphopantetheinyl transferase